MFDKAEILVTPRLDHEWVNVALNCRSYGDSG